MQRSKRIRMMVVGAATTVALTTGLVSGLGPVPGGASSHREAPLISSDPAVDTTDVYLFRSPDNPEMINLISNWWPFEEPAGGPNFYAFDDQAAYDFNIDNNGDAKADMVFRFDFEDHYRNPNTFLYNTGQVTSLSDPDLNFYQTYDLHKLTYKSVKPKGKKRTIKTRDQLLLNNVPVAPSNVGEASMPNYEGDLFNAAVRPVAGGRAFAGQSDDPFYLDLRIFDLLYGGDLSEVGDDTLDGFNVNTIALQLPRSALGRNGDPNSIVGMWATASRRSTTIITSKGTEKHTGKLVQVSRLGMPLVNEAVVPVGKKDLWNGSKPTDDGQFLSHVTKPEIPKLIEAVYGIPAPAEPRNDLVQVFLTGIPDLNQPAGVTPSEMLRLNMSTPTCEAPTCAEYSQLGVIGGDVAGYPNGRRLADDVIDISLQVLEGELVGNPNDLGDGVDVNPEGFRAAFPYVALPTAGSEPSPH